MGNDRWPVAELLAGMIASNQSTPAGTGQQPKPCRPTGLPQSAPGIAFFGCPRLCSSRQVNRRRRSFWHKPRISDGSYTRNRNSGGFHHGCRAATNCDDTRQPEHECLLGPKQQTILPAAGCFRSAGLHTSGSVHRAFFFLLAHPPPRLENPPHILSNVCIPGEQLRPALDGLLHPQPHRNGADPCLAVCRGVVSPAGTSGLTTNRTFGESLSLAVAPASIRLSSDRSLRHHPTRPTLR